MNWVLKRFRVVISIALILSTVITYLIVYLPREDALEDTTLRNYSQLASANNEAFNQGIFYSVNFTENLSAIDSMKQLILSYQQGVVSADLLRSETQNSFLDIVKTMPYITGAYRFADNMLIGSFGNADYSKLMPEGEVVQTFYELDSACCEITVYSPIYYSDSIVGIDIVTFDLSDLIASFIDEDYNYELIPLYSNEREEENFKIISVKDVTLLDDGKHIIYRNRVKGSDMLFQVSIEKNILFAPIKKITIKSLISAVICNVTLLLLTNYIIIHLAQYRLSVIERRKDLYKEYAYKDTLTGAYSRLYLERWVRAQSNNSRFIHEDICVAILDINDYKSINDTRGHAFGDRLLQYFVHFIIESIKEEDLVVRYGGDEFLIILLDTQYEEADRILSTIGKKVSYIDDLGFGITIAYGIHQISSYDRMYEAIEKADKKMYIQKNAYKNSLLYNR